MSSLTMGRFETKVNTKLDKLRELMHTCKDNNNIITVSSSPSALVY